MTDLNTQNPEYLDIRHTERGIQRRKTKKVLLFQILSIVHILSHSVVVKTALSKTKSRPGLCNVENMSRPNSVRDTFE